MTDTTSNGESRDPNASLEALIRVLQEDVRLRTNLFEQLGQLIGSNTSLLQAHTEHSSDLERRFSIEETRVFFPCKQSGYRERSTAGPLLK